MSEQEGERRALQAAGGLARVAAGMWLRTAAWGVGASLRMARAATDPEQATRLIHEVQDSLRGYAREVLGVSEIEDRIRQLMPARAADSQVERANGAAADVEALRAAGAELLRQSADVSVEQSSHPAYVRILEELAPDEARILRLLALEGPQPAVDVRSTQLMGLGSQLVAEGLNMIGQQAGARQPERIAAYLNNLYRLGLIWFSKEPVDDPVAYQVLEAQPGVLAALKGAPRSKTVQRSIGLTPFGKDFCETCLPMDTAEPIPL
jgi:hypothetical protein